MLLAYVKLPMQCLTYLPGRLMKDYSRLEKFQSQQSMCEIQGQKTHFVQRSSRNIYQHLWLKFVNFKYNNVNTIPANARVLCGYGEKSLLHFVLWLELFSLSNPLANDPDKYGKQLVCVCMVHVRRHDTMRVLVLLLCDWAQKKQRFCGTNQKPELPQWFGPLKPCPQGLFSSFLTFLRPNAFLAHLNFFPSPLTAPGSPRMSFLGPEVHYRQNHWCSNTFKADRDLWIHTLLLMPPSQAQEGLCKRRSFALTKKKLG